MFQNLLMNQVLLTNKLFSTKSNIFQLDDKLNIKVGHYQVLHFLEILDYAEKAFHRQTLLIKHSR
jgi:hypothetical protein